MNLKLDKFEAVILSVNMQTLRKNIKKGFKVTYGKKEGQKHIEVFDQVKQALNEGIEQTEEGQQQDYDFQEAEINMLRSFLPWYLLELKTLQNAASKTLNKDDEKNIETLEAINKKIERIIENYD